MPNDDLFTNDVMLFRLNESYWMGTIVLCSCILKAAVPCGLDCLLQLQQQSNDTITTDSRHISFVVSSLVSSYYLRERPNQYFQLMPLYSNPSIDLSGGGGSSIMFNRVIPKPLELVFRDRLFSINPL